MPPVVLSTGAGAGDNTQRGKLAAKCQVIGMHVLGHARNCKAYRLVHRPTRRFLETRDVIFDEGGTTPQTSFIHVVIEHWTQKQGALKP